MLWWYLHLKHLHFATPAKAVLLQEEQSAAVVLIDV
jgi:hypothetical protein